MWVYKQTENQLSPVKFIILLTSSTLIFFYIRKGDMSYFSPPILLALLTDLMLQVAAQKIRAQHLCKWAVLA